MTGKPTIANLQRQIEELQAEHSSEIGYMREWLGDARSAQKSAEAALRPLQEELARCRTERDNARIHELEASRLRGAIERMEKIHPGRNTSRIGDAEYHEERFRP